jgi:hypothetical protein
VHNTHTWSFPNLFLFTSTELTISFTNEEAKTVIQSVPSYFIVRESRNKSLVSSNWNVENHVHESPPLKYAPSTFKDPRVSSYYLRQSPTCVPFFSIFVFVLYLRALSEKRDDSVIANNRSKGRWRSRSLPNQRYTWWSPRGTSLGIVVIDS